MSSVCGLRNCDYKIPSWYNPLNGTSRGSGWPDDTIVGWKEADSIRMNCFVILENASYYIGSDGTLQGYSSMNIPGRVYLWLRNWYYDGEPDRLVAAEIEKTFNYILNIKKSVNKLGPVSFGRGKYYYPYTDLANKIIKNWSRERYPALYDVSHRILHERQMDIIVSTRTVTSGSREEISVGVSTRKNIANNALDTPFATTTVWNEY